MQQLPHHSKTEYGSVIGVMFGGYITLLMVGMTANPLWVLALVACVALGAGVGWSLEHQGH